MSGSAPFSNHHPHSDVHGHGHHGHHHAHEHTEPDAAELPNLSLLQASALVRIAGAIGLLIPLWTAVYLMVF
jgi:hypothetical protein